MESMKIWLEEGPFAEAEAAADALAFCYIARKKLE